MRILVIEDNVPIAIAIKRNLEDAYILDVCHTGEQGLFYAQNNSYDTIILDLNLPDYNGLDICRNLRKLGKNTPIIILTAESDINVKVELLREGADDYVTKPFSLKELRARVDVSLRHINNNGPNGKIVAGKLILDPISRTVIYDDSLITLRKKEFDLLEYLMRNIGQTLTRNMIMDHIWESNENIWANVVDVHIKHLRDKVDRPYGLRSINTVHGIGYKFDPVVAVK